MRCISTKSDGSFLKYGNPDTPFLSKIKLFLNFSYTWGKIRGNFIFFIFYPVLFQYNSRMTEKVFVNPVKFQNFSFYMKSLIILLVYGKIQFLRQGPSKCLFSSFSQAHQKMHLCHNILTIKRHYQGKQMAAQFIKSSKDSKNRVKCYP